MHGEIGALVFHVLVAQIADRVCHSIEKLKILVRAENLIFGCISFLQTGRGPLKNSKTPSQKNYGQKTENSSDSM